MELYEPPDEAQVQAEAGRGPVEPALALGEQIEAARQHFGGNPDTAVLDADDGLGALALHAHSDRAAGRGEAHRVRDQVGDDLVEPLRVGAHPHRVRLDVDRVTSELAGTGQDAHGLADAHLEVHRAARQHDVAAGNAREVEQVADQPPEVGDLVADRAARAVRDRVVTADAIEHAHRADDDRERVAQLVAQHRQELVLRPVGALRLGARGLGPRQQRLPLVLDAQALVDERGGRQHHQRHRPHEDLQQQERFVLGRAHEGAGAAEGLPDRDARQHADQRRRLALAEPDGGPHERRRAQERKRQRHDPEVDEALAEHREADENRREPQRGGLEDMALRRVGPPVARPQHEQRSDDQGSGRVAEPPGEPDGREVGPRGGAPEPQDDDADGGAEGRAQQGREPDELEDVGGAVEDAGAAGEPVHEVRAQQRFERVARGDPQRGGQRAGRGGVHDERAREDRGPASISEHEQRRERDASRRPDGGHAGVDGREREADLAREDIEAEHRGQAHDVSTTGERVEHCAP